MAGCPLADCTILPHGGDWAVDGSCSGFLPVWATQQGTGSVPSLCKLQGKWGRKEGRVTAAMLSWAKLEGGGISTPGNLESKTTIKPGIKLLLGLLLWWGTPDCLHCAFLTSHLSVLLQAGRAAYAGLNSLSISLRQGSSLDITAMVPQGNARCQSTS